MEHMLPNSSHLFSNDVRTDGPPDYWCLSYPRLWHPEPWLVYFIIFGWYNRGQVSQWLPLWRMNGAGPSDPKTPVILLPGIFSNRFGMDYTPSDGDYALARYLANRGRDVFIVEYEQSLEYSSQSFWDNLVQWDRPWRNWYWAYLMTDDPVMYANLDAYWVSLGNGDLANEIVSYGDVYTTTVDSYITGDLMALISRVCDITGQSRVQLVGHSLGAVISFGFLPTQYALNGAAVGGYRSQYVSIPLPPNSVVSVTSICGMSAFVTCPPWLFNLALSGQAYDAWIYRAKFPRYYRYLMQNPPRCPVKLQGVVDSAVLYQVACCVLDGVLETFPALTGGFKYPWLSLYDGLTINYPVGAPGQTTLTGHQVSTPISFCYDGNGFDLLGSLANTMPLFDKLKGYKNIKPFFQFYPAETSHVELINGYIFEGGVPGWPPNLQQSYLGTYQFIWYDLDRFLPPAPFSASCPVSSSSAPALIVWSCGGSPVRYEIWAKQGGGSFVKVVSNINLVRSSSPVPVLTPGSYKLKVRAFSCGGDWRDHSGMDSLGAVDDPALLIPFVQL